MNANLDPTVVAVGLFVGLVIGLPISAVILRAAISLANKIVGGNGAARYEETALPPNAADGANPYATGEVEPSKRVLGDGIPEPSFANACGILLVAVLCNIPIGLMTGFMPGPPIVGSVVGVLIGAGVYAIVYSKMLPTTTPRGLLVYVLQLVIMLVVALLIGGLVMGLMMAMG